MFRLIPSLVALSVCLAGNAALADIFQWEYVNTADPTQGKRQSAVLAPDGAGASAVPGMDLSNRNLAKAYLSGKDLNSLIAINANLSDADLSHSNLRSARLGHATLANANFSYVDLENANLENATLVGANFTGAIIRGANISGMAITENGSVIIGWVGLTASQLYSTASYQNHDLSGVILASRISPLRPVGVEARQDMTGWNFAGQDLRDVDFIGADLTGADFTRADVRGGAFSGLSLEQLYSTASYQAGELSGIDARSIFPEANFAGMNLTNGVFHHVSLLEANLDDADLRGLVVDCRCTWPPQPAFTDNLYAADQTGNAIHPDGRIDGVQLGAGRMLSVRDYDGGGYFASGTLPIMVDDHFTNTGGILRLILEADTWDSTILFGNGIPVALGGTMELIFADGVDLASQIGRTFDLFDWTGVNPAGTFAIATPYAWDLSNLYTTGEVTLIAVPEQATIASLIVGAAIPLWTRRRIAPVAPTR